MTTNHGMTDRIESLSLPEVLLIQPASSGGQKKIRAIGKRVLLKNVPDLTVSGFLLRRAPVGFLRKAHPKIADLRRKSHEKESLHLALDVVATIQNKRQDTPSIQPMTLQECQQ